MDNEWQLDSGKEGIDYRTWIKFICLIMTGLFSYMIFKDLSGGNLSYSVLEIAGYFVISVQFIISAFSAYKNLSAENHSIKNPGLVLVAIGVLPIALFAGLMYVNRAIVTPVVHFGDLGSQVTGMIAALCMICISLWAKTPILIIAGALLFLPDYLLSLKYETLLIMGPLIAFAGISICFWISCRQNK